MNDSELISMLIKEKVVDKAVIGERRPQCTEIVASIGETPIFIYSYKGRYSNKNFIKISTRPEGCMEAIFDPNGLYSIPLETPDNKYFLMLREKIKVIINIHSSNPKE